MITVTLYTRPGCHLCDEAKSLLNGLQAETPHKLVEIDITTAPALVKEYGEQIPVIKVGAYTVKPPLDPLDLKITLAAAQRSLEHDQEIDAAIAKRRNEAALQWTGPDRFSYWMSKHYLAMLNIFVGLYVGLPFLAPALMKAGITAPAQAIYRVYSFACHQFAFRSLFLFGEQPWYPRQSAGLENLVSYEIATGSNSFDLIFARTFLGNEVMGYKVALCERDIAIYLGILGFGLLYIFLRRVQVQGRRLVPNLPWYIWIVIALGPIGLDGVSQLLSQPPLGLFPMRESTPFLRFLTGGLFGVFSAWFAYPMVEETMEDTLKYLEARLDRIRLAKLAASQGQPEQASAPKA